MLTMSDINTITNLRNSHDKSISFISKELGINWRTAKKYADGENLPVISTVKPRGMMYDEKWGEIVISWLEEDSKLTRKNRRNNLSHFEALKELGHVILILGICFII